MLKYGLIVGLGFASIGLTANITAAAQALPVSSATAAFSPGSGLQVEDVRRQWVERVIAKYLESDEPMVPSINR